MALFAINDNLLYIPVSLTSKAQFLWEDFYRHCVFVLKEAVTWGRAISPEIYTSVLRALLIIAL